MKELGSPYFQIVLGTLNMILIWNMKETLWVTVNTSIMDISVCLLKWLVGFLMIGIYDSVSVK